MNFDLDAELQIKKNVKRPAALSSIHTPVLVLLYQRVSFKLTTRSFSENLES